jgi:hypothetical protein
MEKKKRIPYGLSDFTVVNNGTNYYVDKTMYIPMIEDMYFVFLIRPRRFGKSLFATMLEAYYDIKHKDNFERFFQNTWILNNPTPDRGKYLMLTFNFSGINKDKDKVEDDFNDYCVKEINEFVIKYKELLPESLITEIEKDQLAHQKLHTLLIKLRNTDIKIYVIID